MSTSMLQIEGVTLKGTRHGLLLCIREEVDFEEALSQVDEKLKSNSEFLGSPQLSLDLGWRELDAGPLDRLVGVLRQHQVVLVGVLSTSLLTRTSAESMGIKAIIGRLGLAQHQGRALRQARAAESEEAAPTSVSEESAIATPAPPVAPPESEREQEATLYIKRTLRSGQKAVYPGNIVLWGDLNPGAELEAEGDILVLGTVRGRIHAGCAGNSEAQIYCQALHSTVVRIADGIWTGDAKEAGCKLPASVRIVCQKDQLKFEATK